MVSLLNLSAKELRGMSVEGITDLADDASVRSMKVEQLRSVLRGPFGRTFSNKDSKDVLIQRVLDCVGAAPEIHDIAVEEAEMGLVAGKAVVAEEETGAAVEKAVVENGAMGPAVEKAKPGVGRGLPSMSWYLDSICYRSAIMSSRRP